MGYNGPILDQYPDEPREQQSVAGLQAKLLAGVVADDVGTWIPYAPFKEASIDLSGGAPSGTVKIYASNAENMPPNGFIVTIGGTAHPGDLLSVILTSEAFFGDVIGASYTLIGGDTKATAAAKLALNLQTAINNAQDLGPSDDEQIAASLITAAQDGTTPEQINIFASYLNEPIGIEVAVSGTGHTTTITTGQYDSGEGHHIASLDETALGLYSFSLVATWIKATFTGTAAAPGLDVIMQAVLP